MMLRSNVHIFVPSACWFCQYLFFLQEGKQFLRNTSLIRGKNIIKIESAAMTLVHWREAASGLRRVKNEERGEIEKDGVVNKHKFFCGQPSNQLSGTPCNSSKWICRQSTA